MKLELFLNDELSTKGSVKIPLNVVDTYKEKYDNLVSRKTKFKSEVYKTSINGSTFIHVKVPSETVDNFFYDVLIEFISNGAISYTDCDIRIFSNSPSFVFTTAYVMYHYIDEKLSTKKEVSRMTIKGSEKKLPSQAIKDKPVVRNPYELPIPDKTIYYAIFYIIDNLPYLTTINNKHYYAMTNIWKNILSYDEVMTLRDKQKAINSRKKRDEVNKIKDSLKKNEKSLRRQNSTKKSTGAINKVRSTSQKNSKGVTTIKQKKRK